MPRTCDTPMEVDAVPDPDQQPEPADEPQDGAHEDEPQPVRVQAKPAVIFPTGA